MSKVIQERGGHLGFAKHAAPLGERQVRRDHNSRMLIEPQEQAEEQLPSGLTEEQRIASNWPPQCSDRVLTDDTVLRET